MATTQMGFRTSVETHKKVADIAKKQDRSIAKVLDTFVTEQIKRVAAGGYDSIFYKPK